MGEEGEKKKVNLWKIRLVFILKNKEALNIKH